MIGRAAWHYALVMAVGLALLVLWSARPALAKPGTPGPVAAPSAPPAQKAAPAAGAPANDPVAFSDVQPADFFYTPVQHLAGLGVISGYIDGTFRPYNQTTRAQMVKIVILGFDKPLQTPSA